MLKAFDRIYHGLLINNNLNHLVVDEFMLVDEKFLFKNVYMEYNIALYVIPNDVYCSYVPKNRKL